MRCSAAMMMLAIGAVVMPFSWMDSIHRSMGMGMLPDVAIVHYLTRSVSAFYAVYGAVILFLSFDVQRYRPVIIFNAVLGLVFGTVMLPLDLVAGMPLRWTVCEGPFIIALSIAMLWLAKGVRSQCC